MREPTSKKHALDLSIKKYEKLRGKAQNGIQITAREVDGVTCACCAYSDQHLLFDEDGDEIQCSNCPIREFTGEIGCIDTPWPLLHDYMRRKAEADLPQIKPVILECLQREIDFLLKVKAKNQ